MNKELLQLLACPRCRGTLELVAEQGEERGLSCKACAVMYPIRDHIPVMLVEEAVPLNGTTTGKNTPGEESGSGACACS